MTIDEVKASTSAFQPKVSTIFSVEEVATFKIANVTVSITNKKDIPNRFVRFMQKKILGIEWTIKAGVK